MILCVYNKYWGLQLSGNNSGLFGVFTEIGICLVFHFHWRSRKNIPHVRCVSIFCVSNQIERRNGLCRRKQPEENRRKMSEMSEMSEKE